MCITRFFFHFKVPRVQKLEVCIFIKNWHKRSEKSPNFPFLSQNSIVGALYIIPVIELGIFYSHYLRAILLSTTSTRQLSQVSFPLPPHPKTWCIYSPSPEEYIPQLFTKYTLKRLCYAKMGKMIFFNGKLSPEMAIKSNNQESGLMIQTYYVKCLSRV